MKSENLKNVRKTIWKMTGFWTALAFLFIGVQSPASAAELGEYKWSDKLSRGALNIVSSPVEIARTIHVSSESKGYGYGWTVGLVRGVGKTFVRFGAGVIDLVTFPFDFPDENKAPLVKPEYAWQNWGGDLAA